ncbi:SIR2 family protein [Streptosporangium longisporum]
MGEAEWERLLDQLESGDCTPFLGSGACVGALPTGVALSREMARRWEYPFDDDHDLPRVTQYAVMKYGDPLYVKKQVCAELKSGREPDYLHPLEPHGLLAEFPLSVYLTTNYDNFIARSLRGVGKNPNTAVCPWNEDLEYAEELFESEDGWNPRAGAPLIYHLHGSLRDPASVVLTEDDYLEFLTSLAAGGVEGDKRILPPSIRAALTTRSLLFVGYSLRDWTFRVLFHGLLKTVCGVNRRRHVSVQLTPSLVSAKTDVREVRRWLDRYYESSQISIFWGTAEEFCGELRRRMGPPS